MKETPRSVIRPEPALTDLPVLPHPNLFFDAEELERLRAKRRDPAAEALLQEIIRRCDAWMDPAGPDYRDWKTFKDPRWRKREGLLLMIRPVEQCSFVYAVTGEKRYGEFARDLMMAVIRAGLADVGYKWEQKVFHTVEDYPGWRRNATHDFGTYSAAMALFYDLCQGLLSEKDRAAFIAHAQESFKFEREINSEIGRMALINRGSRCAMGNALLALAVYAEADRELTSWAILNGLRLGHAWASFALDTDGASFEGTSYCVTSSVMLAQLGKAAARRGLRDLSNHPNYRELIDFIVYNLSPTHDQVLPINDSLPDIAPFGPLVVSTLHRNGVAQWLYREVCAKMKMSGYADMARTIPDYIYLDPSVQPVHPRDAGYPLAKHFRGHGVVSAMSSWEPDAAQLLFFSGPPVYNGHRQDDQNSFTFCALGDKFAWDGGYDDFAGVHADRAYRRCEYHNAILIDGMGQTGYDTFYWPRGDIAAFDHRDDWTYTRGDASRCYGIDSIITRADRHVLFHRGRFPFAVIVDDLIVDEMEHDYTFNFVAHPDTRVEAIKAGRYAVVGPIATMDLAILSDGAIGFRQDMGGRMPRLQATRRAMRGRFAALLLRAPGLDSSEFNAEFEDEQVRVRVMLNGKPSMFVFRLGAPSVLCEK